MDFPSYKMVIFHSYVTNYQRLIAILCFFLPTTEVVVERGWTSFCPFFLPGIWMRKTSKVGWRKSSRKRRMFAVHLLLALAPCCTHSYISCLQLHIRQGSLKCQSFVDFPRNVLTNLLTNAGFDCTSRSGIYGGFIVLPVLPASII